MTWRWRRFWRLRSSEIDVCHGGLISAVAVLMGIAGVAAAAAGEPTPAARSWHAFASNGGLTAPESRLYLFGGAGQDGYRSDLWYYQVGQGWTEVLPPEPAGKKGKTPEAPGPRGHVGWSCGGSECVAMGGTSGFATLNETWVFSEATAGWSKVNCRRLPCPSARWGPTMVFDPVHQRHLLFGGEKSGAGLNDTYTFDNGAWSRNDAFSRPSPRRSAAAAFVPELGSLGQVVLFGGQEVNRRALCDMWTWSGLGWVEIDTSGGPCLHSHDMAWEETATGGRLVVTGGYVDTNDTPNSETWYFTFGTSGTGGSWSRGTLACTGGTPRPGARMALDIPSQKKVFFGGEDGSVRYDDTVVCESAGAATSAVRPPGSPGRRRASAAFVHPACPNRLSLSSHPFSYFQRRGLSCR